MAWTFSETCRAEKWYLFSCDNEEFSIRRLSASKTTRDLDPMIAHPRRFDMSPLTAAEYIICRVTSLILNVKNRKQHLPKIVIGGVEDYGTISETDDGVILRRWTDGRHSFYKLSDMRDEPCSQHIIDLFADATYLDSSDVMQLVKEVNENEVSRVDRVRVRRSTKAVQLRAVATRVTRIRVRVGTIDIGDDGFISKLPESTVDTMAVQRRSSTDSSIADWVEPLVHIRASDNSTSYCVSRKRSWVNPSSHVLEE